MELYLGRYSCVLLVLMLFVSRPGSALANVMTEVTVNKSVLLNLQKPLERVSIASPATAELVVITPTQLQINGKKPGTTSLIVWERGGKATFFDVRVKGDCAIIQEQIDEVAPNDSIKVDWVNDTIVLSGKATNDATVAKAVQIAQAYAVQSEGGGEPPARETLEVPRSASYQATSVASPEKEEPEKARAGRVRVLNHVVIDEPQQVLLEVKVAQVDKTALKELGISTLVRGTDGEGFSNLVGAPTGELTIRRNGQVVSQFTGIAGQFPGLASFQPLNQYQLGFSIFKQGIGGVLKALASKNLAKILAEPNLLVRSGQLGNFLAGQRIPIAVVTGVGALSATTIQFIDVGIKLNFKPEVLENDLISLRIEPAEVSVITSYLPENGYPVIDTREVRTKVQLRNGESLVLAGLLQEETIKTMSKIPLLGDIPILGALFRSTHDELKEKELMFFITPRLAAPNAPGARVQLPTEKPLTPEQEKELQWMPKP